MWACISYATNSRWGIKPHLTMKWGIGMLLAFHTREEIGYVQKAKRIQIF